MQLITPTADSTAVVMWQPVVAGILCVWKKAYAHFHVFQSVIPRARDPSTNVHLTLGVGDTLQESLLRAHMDIVVHINTEVVSFKDCDSPKAVALYKAQAQDVDRMIAAIQATEEEYMDDFE